MSKINEIRFTIEKDDDGDIEDVTYIDDQYVEGYCIDYEEIAKSLMSPGVYEIFTCGCGVAGCAGIYQGVTVSHENDKITWQLNQPYEAKYIFSKDELYDSLYEFIKHVYENDLEIGSTLFELSGAYSTFHILKKLAPKKNA